MNRGMCAMRIVPELEEADQDQTPDVTVFSFQRPLQRLVGKPLERTEPAQHTIGEVQREGPVTGVRWQGF